MTPYEMRWEMWRHADAFLQSRYRHLMEQYEAGLVPDRPEFPSYGDVSAYALQMRDFVDDGGKTND